MNDNTYNNDISDISAFRGNSTGSRKPVCNIMAIGVGGGGNNAVDHMFRQGIKDVSFVNINTDRKTLEHSCVPVTLEIGNGLGAGNKPEIARNFAEESAEKIASVFDEDTKMVFITAGMGGGTGTGAAPVVARIAKEHGLLTIGIVTIPFLFEGQKKIKKAIMGADEMSKYVDALLVINNERLNEIYGDLDFLNAFAKADDTLTIAARSISELITSKGMIDLDFNDVDTTLRDGGGAIISSGLGEGEHRVTKAIQNALNSPLLKNRNILSSKKLLFHVFFNPNAEEKFLMSETDEITSFVSSINSEVDVIWGVGFDESLGNSVKLTILASGFDVSLEEDESETQVEKVEEKKPHWGFSFATAEKPKPQQSSVGDISDERIAKEYGKSKLKDLTEGKDRSSIIILGLNQLDDDNICDILENNPTFHRDRKIVDDIRTGATDINPSQSQAAQDPNSTLFCFG